MGYILKLASLLGPLVGKTKIVGIVISEIAVDIWEAIKDFWSKLTTKEKVVFVVLFLIACAGWYLWFTKETSEIDVKTDSPVTVTTTRIIYKDKDGVTQTITKPPEGKVSIGPNGASVSRYGLTLVPSGGVALVKGTFEPYGAVRFIFFRSFGLQVGGNNERLFLGADMRLPYIYNVCVSAGTYTTEWKDLGYPYFGASFCLR